MKNLKIFFLFLLLTSCVVGPDYKKPETKVNNYWFTKFTESNVTLSNETEEKWWKNFNDPVLDQLVKIAVENNLDLKIATSRIMEARANIDEKTAKLLPQVNATGSATRSSKFVNPISPGTHRPFNIVNAGFDASWELDFFGSAIRAREAAKAIFESNLEAKNAVLISLIGEVARNYMELRNFQNQLELNKKSILALAEILELEESKKEVGLISDVQLEKIKIELANREAELPDLETALNSAALRIEILLTKQPGELRELLKTSYPEFPELNKKLIISAPINLLRNRPDIKQAERDLATATALEGVAIAAMYPKLSLTGFLGFQSNKTGNLLKSTNRVFAVGSGVSMPILDFGSVKANIKASNARKEQAFLNYQSTVLKALEDVENSLTTYVNKSNKMKSITNSAVSSQKILELNKVKNDSGLISEIDLLRAKIDFYQNHIILIQNQTDLNNSIIALYKALGGGWN
jgi:multidrug efflux system outer membrane protein